TNSPMMRKTRHASLYTASGVTARFVSLVRSLSSSVLRRRLTARVGCAADVFLFSLMMTPCASLAMRGTTGRCAPAHLQAPRGRTSPARDAPASCRTGHHPATGPPLGADPDRPDRG